MLNGVSHLREYLHDPLPKVSNREKQWIMQFNPFLMDKLLWPLYVGFICLSFLDYYYTIVALKPGTIFQELNPIAAALFRLGFPGFLTALILKYIPAIPLFYAVFVKDPLNRYPLEIRAVKLIGLVALTAGNAYLFWVVANNATHLIIYANILYP